MTVNRIFKSVAGFLAAACVALAFVVLDVGALSQNTNSSTTTQEDEANANANTNTTPQRRRGRRGRRRAPTTPAPDATPTEPAEGTGEGETTPRPEVVINRGAPPQNPSGGTQEDLSGTYTGRVTMTGGHEMSGDGTLTITGNTFTLEAGGTTHSGRIYAINTRRYIGVALYFTDIMDAATNTPLAASVRARRQGNSFSLTPIPGTRNRLTFRGRSS